MKFYIIFFLLVIMTSLTQAQLSSKQKVDTLLSEYEGEVPGASVMIIIDDDVQYKTAIGYADLENDITVTYETNFRLASFTKQFTAAGILILIEEGKLSLDTKLTEVFPEVPSYGKNITIENLLNHTSGIIDYEDLIPEDEAIPIKDKDVLDLILDIDSVYFQPGERFKYSNTAYALLKLIIEKISGQTYAHFLNANIFEPLEMETTIAYERGISEVKNRAYGHQRTDSGWIKKDQSMTSAVLGDGGIYSNIEDLYKWEQSLYTDQILPKSVIEKATTRKKLNDGSLFDYGYGWRLSKFGNEEVVYHTGSTIGGRTIIYRIPSKKFAVIILSNRDEGDTLEMAEKIAEIYLNK